MPVSYTHLDVYKRQDYGGVKYSGFNFCDTQPVTGTFINTLNGVRFFSLCKIIHHLTFGQSCWKDVNFFVCFLLRRCCFGPCKFYFQMFVIKKRDPLLQMYCTTAIGWYCFWQEIIIFCPDLIRCTVGWSYFCLLYTSTLFIPVQQKQYTSVVVQDLKGQIAECVEVSWQEDGLEMDTSALRNGLYIIQVQTCLLYTSRCV